MGTSNPRKQQLLIATQALSEPIFAVLRVSWYEEGKVSNVDELQFVKGSKDRAVIRHLVDEALGAGADVCLVSEATAEELGFDV